MSTEKKVISDFSEHRFLSNFYPSPLLSFDGVKYPDVETAYQAAKTNDKVTKLLIRDMMPGTAKRYGRTIPLPKDWEIDRIEIMEDLVYRKFSQNPSLARQLLATGDAEIIEGNKWHDNFWGVCCCGKCQKAGGAKNSLGLILMFLRSELKPET